MSALSSQRDWYQNVEKAANDLLTLLEHGPSSAPANASRHSWRHVEVALRDAFPRIPNSFPATPLEALPVEWQTYNADAQAVTVALELSRTDIHTEFSKIEELIRADDKIDPDLSENYTWLMAEQQAWLSKFAAGPPLLKALALIAQRGGATLATLRRGRPPKRDEEMEFLCRELAQSYSRQFGHWPHINHKNAASGGSAPYGPGLDWFRLTLIRASRRARGASAPYVHHLRELRDRYCSEEPYEGLAQRIAAASAKAAADAAQRLNPPAEGN